MHIFKAHRGSHRQQRDGSPEKARGFFSRRHRHRGGGRGGRRRSERTPEASHRVLMVGNPNVGKSALFNKLTGSYVVVSNYPGTTVALSRGRMRYSGKEYAVVDTPGMYTVFPITEEERVSRRMLMEDRHDVILHVVDAKNLPRMLPFTLQLIEAGLPVILVLNIMDEAEQAGLSIDTGKLEDKLGVPVVATVGISGKGIKDLREVIAAVPIAHGEVDIDYGVDIERAVKQISDLMPETTFSSRATALLALQEDKDVLRLLSTQSSDRAQKVFTLLNRLKKNLGHPVGYYLTVSRQQKSERILRGIMTQGRARGGQAGARLDSLLISPWTGIPILLAVLYFGFYRFVGGFGAGTVVDFLEGHLFEQYFVPFINGWTERLIPWKILQDLIAMDYGVLTLGVRYAVALVMPIVGAFFIVFSIVEDSGYLPRLSLLIDRVFKKIGLSGRAVIPMTLGFGCGTMATMVTRTLESVRERVIATILLALAIPCSAQLGVIFGLASDSPGVIITWIGTVGVVFMLIGYLTARILPGETPDFFMELPPLRLPRLANVWVKTSTRMRWYFMEILPLFLLASVLIWAGNITGLFEKALWLLSFPSRWIGLPAETAQAFLFGFFRRDYGVAGLYDIHQAGALSGNQLAVATITLTLFLPCIAQYLVMLRERGWRMATAVAAFVFPFAFLVGGVVNWLLDTFNINLG